MKPIIFFVRETDQEEKSPLFLNIASKDNVMNVKIFQDDNSTVLCEFTSENTDAIALGINAFLRRIYEFVDYSNKEIGTLDKYEKALLEKLRNPKNN